MSLLGLRYRVADSSGDVEPPLVVELLGLADGGRAHGLRLRYGVAEVVRVLRNTSDGALRHRQRVADGVEGVLRVGLGDDRGGGEQDDDRESLK